MEYLAAGAAFFGALAVAVIDWQSMLIADLRERLARSQGEARRADERLGRSDRELSRSEAERRELAGRVSEAIAVLHGWKGEG